MEIYFRVDLFMRDKCCCFLFFLYIVFTVCIVVIRYDSTVVYEGFHFIRTGLDVRDKCEKHTYRRSFVV